jgi:hypothetical protein
MDPKKTQKARASAQHDVRKMVDRELTSQIKNRGTGPHGPVEEALVRAVYAPDRRLG